MIMVKRKKNLPSKYQPWIDAQKRFHLTDEQIQMARELGLNPKKFGSMDNHKQEPWKTPLPVFIEELYLKHFGKIRPDNIRSIRQLEQKDQEKKSEKAAKKSLKKPNIDHNEAD
jgi:hypothetical protein